MGIASPPAPRKRYQPPPPRPVACQSPLLQGRIGEVVAERASVIPYIAPFVGVGMGQGLQGSVGPGFGGQSALFSTERQALETLVYPPPHRPGEVVVGCAVPAAAALAQRTQTSEIRSLSMAQVDRFSTGAGSSLN